MLKTNVCSRELILSNSNPKAMFCHPLSFHTYRTLIYLQVLLFKPSGFSSLLHRTIGLMWVISSAGVGGRNFDRFALFHICQQLRNYILWLLWQAFLAPGLKGFRDAATSKCCFHNTKPKCSSLSPWFFVLLRCKKEKFSNLLFQSTVSVQKPSQKGSLVLKRNQQTCL